MNRLVVTVNESAQISRLRTAISQLRGVEQVTMLREAKPMGGKAVPRKLYKELLERADSLGQLADGWDGQDSKAIAPESIRRFKSAIAKADEILLEGWILFPDARGNLYLDYTGSDAVAGITMTDDRLVYFFKKDGRTVRNDHAAFTSRNLLSILSRVHG